MVQRTLSMIKPDAVSKNTIGGIIKMMEEAGLKIVAAKMLRLDRAQAQGFYAVHKERPFFGSLCDFMTSGPIVAMILEGDDAITRYRDLMGATDSALAAEGTIRHAYGESKEANAVHGSDSPENAEIEINYYFTDYELRGLGW